MTVTSSSVERARAVHDIVGPRGTIRAGAILNPRSGSYAFYCWLLEHGHLVPCDADGRPLEREREQKVQPVEKPKEPAEEKRKPKATAAKAPPGKPRRGRPRGTALKARTAAPSSPAP